MWPFSIFGKKEEAPAPVAEPEVVVESALAKLQREVFERIVSGAPGPEGIEDWRLQVYAGMYEARTHDALIEDVPHTAKLLGDAFLPSVNQYVKAVPSPHHSLANLGHGYAQWLTTQEMPRPDLADLAALEWARSEAFVALNSPHATPETVQQMGPERFSASKMVFVPSLRLVTTKHRVSELWKSMEHEQKPLDPEPGEECLVIWRKGFEVFHDVIEANEMAALQAAVRGESLTEVCACFSADGEDAAHVAFRAIGSWLNEGMVWKLEEP